MMGLKLWAAFSLYGAERLGQLVDTVFASARLFAEKLAEEADFALLMPPQTNILCFRYVAGTLPAEELNARQAGIRQGIVQNGEFHLTQVELHGKLWLRTTLMNPLTEAHDMDALITSIRKHSTL